MIFVSFCLNDQNSFKVFHLFAFLHATYAVKFVSDVCFFC